MAPSPKNDIDKHDAKACGEFIVPIRDTLDVLSGKWKLPILGALRFGKKRFKEIEREIPHITARMLSKELKELEMNELITRTVYATIPVTVEYEVTPYGKTLDTVLQSMKDWGVQHRRRIMGKKK
ncbi:MAG: helix-turn-helix transcriptional regulator [Bacteroidetes bacterium]|nr:helix-turn-helix transcriptional regulator [Bacteroidota bacterium]MBS1617498.1 helix-turn-helix transcriptional regulator [Bacteroidota bacterium]